ncbi:MAG: TM2 domain-containing protein [Alphaproteobacteria bacterium]|jgi:TM2 domain-containing membrane protein YozV|nr:TM2 domain-containing protein [Alphaproteobacteria bacterium]
MKIENKSVLLGIWKDKITAEQLVEVSKSLENIDDTKLENFMLLPLKSPKLAFALSLCFGVVGIDRFYLGDKILGILKALCFLLIFVFAIIMLIMLGSSGTSTNHVITMIVCIIIFYSITLVWYILDIFLVFRKSKKINFNVINKELSR